MPRLGATVPDGAGRVGVLSRIACQLRGTVARLCQEGLPGRWTRADNRIAGAGLIGLGGEVCLVEVRGRDLLAQERFQMMVVGLA